MLYLNICLCSSLFSERQNMVKLCRNFLNDSTRLLGFVPLCCDARSELQQAVVAVSPCLAAVSCCLVIRFFMLTVATLSALFPAASRLKRDSANVTGSMFHNSVEDVRLLFEVQTIRMNVLHE